MTNVLSGALHIAMDDGTEIEVVGDEPCVLYDLGTADDADFGKPPTS
jgi:hypothetical protein